MGIIESALVAWLNAMRESREQAAQGLIPADPAWLPTPTAEIIQTALRYAHKLADITVIYGGAGLGKTLTANQYREEHPNVWIATMTPAINTVGACLERVASAVGISTLFPSIDTLLDAWGVADKKARALCREIGGKPGALRGLSKVLRMAWFMRGDGEPVTYDLVADAWADQGGMA